MAMDNQNWTPEEQLIRLIRKGLKRHPKQRNHAFSADAELIDFSGGSCLALTTDSLQEEIRLGILENPWTIGWTAAVINLSDLAAVGAGPLGMLFSWTVPPDIPSEIIRGISKGISDAVRFHKTYVLGGDFNSGEHIQICGTAIGTVKRPDARQRLGLRPGDTLFLSGPIGLGNALGLAKLNRLPEADRLEKRYRPKARFDLQEIVRRFASSCIDTSDGVLAGFDVLSRLNHCGILFRHRPSLYHRDARNLSNRYNIPLWLFAAGENGEFELLFSVRAEAVAACKRRCSSSGISLMELGRATAEEGIRMELHDSEIFLDVPKIRSMTALLGKNPREYVESLLQYAGETVPYEKG